MALKTVEAAVLRHDLVGTLPSSSKFTVMRWLKVDGNAGFRDVFYFGDLELDSYVWMGIDSDGLTPAFESWHGPTADDDYVTAAGFPLDASQFFHLALTRDGANFELFLSSESGSYDAMSVLTTTLVNTISSPRSYERFTWWMNEQNKSHYGCAKIFSDQVLTAAQIRRQRDRMKA